MFICAYHRASTTEQMLAELKQHSKHLNADHDQVIASECLKNVSGASAHRPEMTRLLEDARTRV